MVAGNGWMVRQLDGLLISLLVGSLLDGLVRWMDWMDSWLGWLFERIGWIAGWVDSLDGLDG